MGYGMGTDTYLQPFCGFLGFSSHFYPSAVRQELGLPHRKKWDVKDIPQLLFLGQWNQSKSQGLHRAGSRNRLTKPLGTVAPGAQKLLHEDGGGNWRWPFGIKTHR